MQIGEYELLGSLTTENAGFSKWGFASKDGKTYFIKEFSSPVYPISGKMDEKQIKQKKELCQKYEEKMKCTYEAVNRCSNGNLVRIQHFFRFRSRYYIVTEKIDTISMDKPLNFPLEQRKRLCQILLHSVYCLHREGLIHGDLKPENILFKKLPSGDITAKLIDFDTCFRENELDPSDEIHCDFVYMAPETLIRELNEEGEITSAIDVFALGLIFHKIMAGSLPSFSKEYDYPCEALVNEKKLYVNCEIQTEIKNLIEKMLDPDPEKRITLAEAFEYFGEEVPGEEVPGNTTFSSFWHSLTDFQDNPREEPQDNHKSKLRGDLVAKK